MRITTALNHQRRFMSRMGDIYLSARLFGSTHAQILDSRSAVFEDSAWKLVPSWVQRDVMQLSAFLADQMYKPVMHESELRRVAATGDMSKIAFLRWQLRLDGEHTTSDAICALRAGGDEEVWQRVEGAHIWNHKPHKPYQGWKCLGSKLKQRKSDGS